MTIDIAKLRALLAAGTARPWRSGAVEKTTLFVPEPDAIGGMERVLCRLNVYGPYKATAPTDAQLIAAAVNALPDLLAIAEAAFEMCNDRLFRATTALEREQLQPKVRLLAAVDAARKEDA